jgi:hypothetical protein
MHELIECLLDASFRLCAALDEHHLMIASKLGAFFL